MSISIFVSVYLRYIYTKPRYVYIPNPVIGLASPEMECLEEDLVYLPISPLFFVLQ